ncbi:MAG: selenocysteine-specific translation elongation factor [Sphingomonadales bacterium]|nr:selenocysteine-specific translation elongation factor [Sphingomonadales bacterium]
MLIATAGHIDHGKTALVRALTGVETDRLPEEKARGISIDLGFAYWRPDADRVIGFVDVPGHERFVRNMLAGVGGIDLALVVIAADDGVMPQTIEHLRILDLLGISRGVVAITKTDKVDAMRVAVVRDEVKALLAQTTLAAAPIHPVSAKTGAGIAQLAGVLRSTPPSPRAHDRGFRMAVDRCFTVGGAGTVVTGTVLAGTLAPGARLVLAPRGLPARVRGLQSAGRAVETIAAGARCAVNLAGVDVADVHRGDWLVPDGAAAPTTRIEARITLLAGRAAALRHGTTVHLHIGTAAQPARVLMPRQARLEPGTNAVAVLALEQPTLALNGERFVLRVASGRELLGGGRVIDPFAPLRRRRDASREAVLAALELHEPEASLRALLAIPGHEIDGPAFTRAFDLTDAAAHALFAAAGARRLGTGQDKLLAASRADAISAASLETLAAWHREHPELGGMTRRELRDRLPQAPSSDALGSLLRELADAGRIAFAGPLLRLPGHAASFGKAEVELWNALRAEFEDGPPRPLSAPELARDLRASEATVRTMLYRRRANGDLWALDDSRFLLRDHVATLAAAAAAIAREGPEALTAARFRDVTGIGRNHVIRILEFFDRIGVTARRGDARVVRADYADITGGRS